MKTYQIEGSGKMVGELSVIEPRLKTDNMKAVLAVFQGRARLVDAPEQIFDVPTTTVATTPASTVTGQTDPPTTTLVPVYVESNSVGILPTNDPACR